MAANRSSSSSSSTSSPITESKAEYKEAKSTEEASIYSFLRESTHHPIQYTWMGPPAATQETFLPNHDIAGPKVMAEVNCVNPILIWCLDEHKKEYQEKFRNYRNVRVCSLETFLTELINNPGHPEQQEAKRMEEILNVRHDPTHEAVRTKDIVSTTDGLRLFLVAKFGGYYFDTNIFPLQNNVIAKKPIAGLPDPQEGDFYAPMLTFNEELKKRHEGISAAVETWALFARTDKGKIMAKTMFNHFFKGWKEAQEIFKTLKAGEYAEYSDYLGWAIIDPLQSNSSHINHWGAAHRGATVRLELFNFSMCKIYLNTHNIGGVGDRYLHSLANCAYTGDILGVECLFLLGINLNGIWNNKTPLMLAIEGILYYRTTNRDDITTGMAFYSEEEYAKLKCIKFLLNAKVDSFLRMTDGSCARDLLFHNPEFLKGFIGYIKAQPDLLLHLLMPNVSLSPALREEFYRKVSLWYDFLRPPVLAAILQKITSPEKIILFDKLDKVVQRLRVIFESYCPRSEIALFEDTKPGPNINNHNFLIKLKSAINEAFKKVLSFYIPSALPVLTTTTPTPTSAETKAEGNTETKAEAKPEFSISDDEINAVIADLIKEVINIKNDVNDDHNKDMFSFFKNNALGGYFAGALKEIALLEKTDKNKKEKVTPRPKRAS